jgi:SH3-like domain-containing protein
VAGETAQLVATQGVWQRIRFSDGREGWMERRRLESLELPAVR